MKKLFALAVTSSLVAPFSALAVDVPSTADSSRIEQKLTREKPKLQVTDEALVGDQEEAPNPNAANISFTLSSVSLEGNTVFSEEQISKFYADKLGKEVTLQEMYVVRDEITKFYREKGYILSRAVIPAQKLGKGKADFKIRVIEGYLNSVTVEGDFKGDQDILDNHIAKIKAAGPLNSDNLERYLLLLNDLPGVEANAVLKPAQGAGKTGASDLVIQMGHDYLDGVVTLDNSGSKFIGRELVTAEARLNSALSLSEQIRVRGIVSGDGDELRFGDISYEQPIGYEGTTWRLGYGKTASKPGSTVKQFKFEGDTTVYDFEVTHPFLRTRKENFSGRVGFTAKDTNTDTFGVNLYDDRTREIFVGGTYDLADTWGGVNLLDFSATKGLNIFNESNENDLLSRANGETDFFKLNLEASRLQNVYGNLDVLFATMGQYSFDPLLAGNEFGIGGNEYGRGYDFSEITGDHGIEAKIEFQYGIDLGNDYVTSTQLYTFYDIGAIWQEDPLPGEDHRESLASVGLGSRFNLFNTASGYVEVGKPLTRPIAAEGDHDWRFNFGLSYIF